MKKIICLITILIASFAVSFGLVACDEGPKTYTIKLIVDEDVVLENTNFKVTEGKEYELPTPSKVGYTFNGWYDEEENKIDMQGIWTYGNIKLIASFDAKQYNLNVAVDGGTLEDGSSYPSIIPVTFGSTYSLPQPVRKGYTFSGWKKGTSDFSATGTWQTDSNTVSITAQWSANTYKVKFETELTDAVIKTPELDFVYDSKDNKFADVEYDNEKYRLKGWKIKGTDTVLQIMPKWKYDEEITLVAQFEEIIYTVSFDNMQGEQLPLKGGKGTVVKLPAPTKTGYTLTGFKNGEDIVPLGDYTITGNVTLVGVWAPKTFNITLDAGDKGTVASSSFSAIYAQTKFSDIPSAIPNAGQEFTGWSYNGTMLEGDDVWNIDASDIVLVANYRGESYVFAFETQEGTLKDTSITLTYGTTYTLKTLDSNSTRRFKGWSYNGEIVANSGIWEIVPNEDNPKFVAVWEDRTTTITFNSLYAGEYNEIVVKYGDVLELHDISDTYVINNNLYIFEGWSYDGIIIESGDIWTYEVDKAELVAQWRKDTNWSGGIEP